MFGRLPLMVFCATKILLDDYYGNPHPGAASTLLLHDKPMFCPAHISCEEL